MIQTLIQHPISRLVRLDKPVGTLLVLWPTLWALWLASDGTPNGYLLVIFCLGAFFTRSAGCIINDLWDKDFDGKVKRTATRPLANGDLSPKTALIILAILALCSLGLVLCLNHFSLLLAFVAAGLTALYPACKRFLPIPQLVLGVTFNMGVLIAYAAVQNHLPWQAWLLYLIANLWTLAYDTEYAMVDRDDDLKLGLKSSAICFGNADRLVIGLCQAAVLIGLTILASLSHWNWHFYAGLLICSVLFGYQQQLIARRERTDCFKAFKNNQWVGLVLLIICAASLH